MPFAAIKDPDAVLDYRIDWSEVLELNNPTDTITASSWSTSGNLAIDSDSFTDTEAIVWVSGGTLTELCKLVNIITTAGGRDHVKTINVSLKDT